VCVAGPTDVCRGADEHFGNIERPVDYRAVDHGYDDRDDHWHDEWYDGNLDDRNDRHVGNFDDAERELVLVARYGPQWLSELG
jgi:hypothetical protein